MRLSDWADQHRKQLREEPPDAAAMRALLAVVDREIGDAQGVPSDDGRLEHAHAACVAAARAALAASGYRLRSGISGHHGLAVESLLHTVGLRDRDVNELHNYSTSRWESSPASTRRQLSRPHAACAIG
jgi:hypothetical protein